MLQLGLTLRELRSDTMKNAMTLILRYSQASRNDCFALALAVQEKCALLTGDKQLRRAAEKESVLVKGTLWLVSLMVRDELISVNIAREAFQRMKETGRRLPWAMVDAMLTNLESDILG